MNLTNRAQNLARRLLQGYGTTGVKRLLWDREFAQGRWNCLEASPGDAVYKYVEKYASQGSILDLGCGSGNTSTELDSAAYTKYVGVDVSSVAVESSRAKARECHREAKNSYLQSDIISYVPDQRFEVILFRDSIYYIPQAKISKVLKRYAEYLKESGVFVVRMWDTTGKYKTILDCIEDNFDVVERYTAAGSGTAVIVFQLSR